MWDIGKGIGELFITMAVIICIFVPLGLWKLVEIAIWFFHHVSIGWS